MAAGRPASDLRPSPASPLPADEADLQSCAEPVGRCCMFRCSGVEFLLGENTCDRARLYIGATGAGRRRAAVPYPAGEEAPRDGRRTPLGEPMAARTERAYGLPDSAGVLEEGPK